MQGLLVIDEDVNRPFDLLESKVVVAEGIHVLCRELLAVLHHLVSILGIAYLVDVVHLLGVILEDLCLHIARHIAQNNIQCIVQQLTSSQDFLEGLENLLLLPKVPCLIEVTQQDSQEQVKHDDRSEHEQHNEVERHSLSLCSDALVHDLVPRLAHQHLEDGNDRPVELVEVSPWRHSVDQIKLVVLIELHGAGEEGHSQQSKHVHEQKQQDHVVTDGC